MSNTHADSQFEREDFPPGSLIHPNGYVATDYQVEQYNNYTKDINNAIRLGNKQAEQMLKMNRFNYFMAIAEQGVH